MSAKPTTAAAPTPAQYARLAAKLAKTEAELKAARRRIAAAKRLLARCEDAIPVYADGANDQLLDGLAEWLRGPAEFDAPSGSAS